MSDLNSFSVLVLSTAHLTPDIAAELDRHFRDGPSTDPDQWAYWIVGSPWSDYGWWIWAELEQLTELPWPLRDALKFAADRGHRFVQFDRDEPEIEELPTWEW